MSLSSTDPLSLVRQSREEISRSANHDPAKVIAALRRDQRKYAAQIQRYTAVPAAVGEAAKPYRPSARENTSSGPA
ncbi:MAG: hypothetical protein JJT96_20620 [Opitutales bacterium]|nr:hypothetical protein [Opitutales bacterium]